MSSSRKGKKVSKTTGTQTSTGEGTEPDTEMLFDTSKTGQMRKREWTRKAFSRRPKVGNTGLRRSFRKP